MNFCSKCGSSELQFKVPENDNLPRYCCDDCGEIHYQNPNMVVGAIATKDTKILLAKRAIEPRKGYWNIPCGFLELNETVEEGAMREVLEETGATIDLGNLHTVYNLPHANQIYLIFTAALTSNFVNKTAESSEVALFAPNEIPWQEIAFSSNTFALKKFIESDPNTHVHLGTFRKNKTS